MKKICVTVLENCSNVKADYVVMVSRFEDKWLMVRHNARKTWEFPGGHVERGESAEAAARRELFEETGATECRLTEMFAYRVERDSAADCGILYFAEIEALAAKPESEIAEVRLFDAIPANLTYEEIYAVIISRALKMIQPNGLV